MKSYVQTVMNLAESEHTSIHFFLESSLHGLSSGKTPGLLSSGPERGTPKT